MLNIRGGSRSSPGLSKAGTPVRGAQELLVGPLSGGAPTSRRDVTGTWCGGLPQFRRAFALSWVGSEETRSSSSPVLNSERTNDAAGPAGRAQAAPARRKPIRTSRPRRGRRGERRSPREEACVP
jgi:hypothetical protein